MCFKISRFLLLASAVFLISGCQNFNDTAARHRGKNKPTRAPAAVKPLKKVNSDLDEITAKNCIKNNILHFGIPSNFVNEETLTDNSRIVILKNPDSGGEGFYVRVSKDKERHSTLELYDNNIKYISKSWRTLLEKCQR